MARSKKDGVFVNCYMQRDVFDGLSAYAARTGMSKTVVMEKAIKQYIDNIAPVQQTDVTVDSLLSRFSSGHYVYPAVLMRNLHISYSDAITILDNIDYLEKVKYYRCPRCSHCDLSSAVSFDEPTDDTFYCPNCDEEFSISNNENMNIAYFVK